MAEITRRDFINGTLMAVGSSMLPIDAYAQSAMAALDPSYYPPGRTGLRGSHPGSMEHAHSRAWDGRVDWGPVTKTGETYDLVVVGGGLSGLAAGYFFQRKHGTDKKVLILDNHDDFGGHAKRNEHMIDGTMVIGEGGSESFEAPYAWDEVMLDLMDELGVDMDRFSSTYDAEFFKRHNLGSAAFFNERVFGENKLVMHPFGDYPGFIEGLLRPTISVEEAVAEVPLSKRGREQLLRVMTCSPADLGLGEGASKEEIRTYIRQRSYFDFLQNTLGVDDELVLRMARNAVVEYGGGGADVKSIFGALASGGVGLNSFTNWKGILEPGEYQEYIESDDVAYSVERPFIHHFPDGNAGIARTLVKKLVPNVGPGDTAEEIVMSRFRYEELDKASNSARIRLKSTVVNVEHAGDPDSADEVLVNYIRDDKAFQVRGKGVVMAGYNMMIPYIVPNLPEEQEAALSGLSKLPLQYTTVGLKNWRAMKELGIGMAMCPGNMHQAVGMDYPVSMGGYEFTKTPDDPCVLHMRCAPLGNTVGAPRVEQFIDARRRMLSLSFDDYEKEVREHLGGMFPKELFEFDRDVASITVNRWGHAYAYGNPGPVGRKKFGRITIANSDAVSSSVMQSAIGQAYRAVNELG